MVACNTGIGYAYIASRDVLDRLEDNYNSISQQACAMADEVKTVPSCCS